HHKTHYRAPRFDNRPGWEGKLPPSATNRVHHLLTWIARRRRLCPIGSLSLELMRIAPQLLEHPEIRGVEYQQGTLAGYEARRVSAGEVGAHVCLTVARPTYRWKSSTSRPGPGVAAIESAIWR